MKITKIMKSYFQECVNKVRFDFQTHYHSDRIRRHPQNTVDRSGRTCYGIPIACIQHFDSDIIMQKYIYTAEAKEKMRNRVKKYQMAVYEV